MSSERTDESGLPQNEPVFSGAELAADLTSGGIASITPEYPSALDVLKARIARSKAGAQYEAPAGRPADFVNPSAVYSPSGSDELYRRYYRDIPGAGLRFGGLPSGIPVERIGSGDGSTLHEFLDHPLASGDVLRIWDDKGFSLKQYVENSHGIFLEVAGPTPTGYDVLNVDQIDLPQDRILTSNIMEGLPLYLKDRIMVQAGVDLVADGTALPVRDEALQGIFVSCINGADGIYSESIRAGLIIEAQRALIQEGILVFQGAQQIDLDFGLEHGFEAAEVAILERMDGMRRMTVVFRKTSSRNSVNDKF